MKVSEILDSLNDILGGDIKIKYSKKDYYDAPILTLIIQTKSIRIYKWILILILDKDSWKLSEIYQNLEKEKLKLSLKSNEWI